MIDMTSEEMARDCSKEQLAVWLIEEATEVAKVIVRKRLDNRTEELALLDELSDVLNVFDALLIKLDIKKAALCEKAQWKGKNFLMHK